MAEDSSDEYHQNNKERLQKDINVFLRKKRGKKQHYGCERYKIYRKMRNKSLLSIEKSIIK